VDYHVAEVVVLVLIPLTAASIALTSASKTVCRLPRDFDPCARGGASFLVTGDAPTEAGGSCPRVAGGFQEGRALTRVLIVAGTESCSLLLVLRG